MVGASTLPAATEELVRLRASQINGCIFCPDMHAKDTQHAGETQLRLNQVAVSREATVFTDAERAALELIAEINAWNRLNLITRRPAGDYRPGQFH